MPRDALVAHLSSLAEEASRSNLHRMSVLRNKEDHIKEDIEMFAAGVLDLHSMLNGYRPHEHPIEVAFRHADGSLYAVRRQSNLQVDDGRNGLERGALFSDIAANAFATTFTAAATATSATSLTNTGAAFPTSGGLNGSLQGHLVWAVNGTTGLVFGVILSNTATVLTVDRWYDPKTGNAGTTPAATALYAITPGMGTTNWIGLSTDTTTPAAADVLRTADGLFGNGTGAGTATEQTGSGLARTLVLPTFPATHQTQLQNTWTYTGAVSVTIAKVVLCNSLAAAGSKLHLETLLSATATVAASGDSIQVTWTVNN